jgi:Concanavalin A-like lectin/glucanases superfamily
VTRFASLGRRSQLALGALACSALFACTQPRAEGGPTSLERHVDDSGKNRALSFDGAEEYLTTGTAGFPDGLGSQTLSLWFKVDAIVGQQALLTLRKDLESGIEVELRDGIIGAWRVFAPDRVLVASKATVSIGKWHLAVFTFDRSTWLLYLDGEQVATSTNLSEKRTPTTCFLGTIDGTRDLFQGQLDNVHVFELARTAAQIKAEFGGDFSNAADGLVLDLPFDEGGGDVVYDHSPRENDGELGDGVPLRMPTRVDSDAPHFD